MAHPPAAQTLPCPRTRQEHVSPLTLQHEAGTKRTARQMPPHSPGSLLPGALPRLDVPTVCQPATPAGPAHRPYPPPPELSTPHALDLECFPTHEGTELGIPPLVNRCGLQMRPLLTKKRQMLPKVTQLAGTAQADPTAAQTWMGDCWQVPEPVPSGPWQKANKRQHLNKVTMAGWDRPRTQCWAQANYGQSTRAPGRR